MLYRGVSCNAWLLGHLAGPVSRSESMVQDFKKKEIDFAADVKMITYLLKGKHQTLAESPRLAGAC